MKLMVYIFDSILDVLYIINNIFKGGQTLSEPNLSILYNLAILHPSFSLFLRARSVHRFVVFSKSDGRQQLHNVLTKTLDGNISPNTRKTIEKLAAFTLAISATIFAGTFAYNVQAEYFRCNEELSPPLWSNAYPKNMFAHGLLQMPTCGYATITIIDANNSGITTIPEIIANCTSLQVLHLRNNRTNPCKITKISFVTFYALRRIC